MRVDRTHGAGNVAVVEAALLDPDQRPDWQLPFCAVLTWSNARDRHLPPL